MQMKLEGEEENSSFFQEGGLDEIREVVSQQLPASTERSVASPAVRGSEPTGPRWASLAVPVREVISMTCRGRTRELWKRSPVGNLGRLPGHVQARPH